MSAESIVYAALNVVGVTTHVGSNICAAILPQGRKLPAIVYVRTGTENTTTIHSAAPVASLVTMDIWCIAESFAKAEDIADAAEVAMVPVVGYPVDRRQEVDPETEALITILTYNIWT
ncbi:hypothetical protein ACHMW6_06430 [Pseudoduganella sp. UC29_106]|uniref:hypothetical protein n=1 Tax=Pseudoduganella sp. UC29_106 TaxID=3374553 RepID=UPI003758221E